MESIPVVAFLGPAGTYTHQATLERFEKVKEQVIFEACGSIKETFERVKGGEARFGLLPWENSIQGQVKDTYESLGDEAFGREVFIGGEYTFGIDHCLLVQKGETIGEITRVMSHEQALGQCKDWLKEHIPRAELVKVTSTAGAAKMISRGGEAAICSRICVGLYGGLDVLAEGIQDENNNQTRFMVVTREEGEDGLKIGPSRGLAALRALIRTRVGAGAELKSEFESTSVAGSGHASNTLMGKVGRIFEDGRVHVLRVDRRGEIYFFELAADDGEAIGELSRRIDGVLLGMWV